MQEGQFFAVHGLLSGDFQGLLQHSLKTGETADKPISFR